MTIVLIITIVVGVITGLYVFPEHLILYIDQGVTIGLCILLFFIGIDIGKNKEVFNNIKRLGWKTILIPFSIAIGSIVGAISMGYVIKLPVWEAAAVGSGMGWYSLTAVLIDQLHSTQLAAIGFLSDVIRELLAILILPIIATHLKPIYAIAPAGAAAMDTMLPIIARYTSSEIAVLAFISGLVLSTMVPFLVPFFLQFA